MNIKLLVLTLSLLSLSISGCTALQGIAKDALLGSQDGLSVDANVAKGDAEGTSSVAQNANTAVSVGGGTSSQQEYGSVAKVVNESGMKAWHIILIVLLAGWAIPSPSEMVVGTGRAIRSALGLKAKQ